MHKLISSKKLLYIFVGLALLYVLPIILANVYYTDDMGRITNGGVWHHDGRFIATYLARLLSFSREITSLYPYSVIISAVMVLFAGFIVSSVLELDVKWTLAPIFILISPFLLENLAYRFDSLYMTLSILLAVVPFLYRESRFFALVSIICLVTVMGLYQTTAMFYIALLLLIQLKNILEDKGIGWKLLVVSLISFIVAFILYKFFIKILGLQVGRSSFLPLNYESLSIIKSRLLQYFALTKQLFIESRYSYAMLLTIFFAFVGFCLSLLSQKSILRVIIKLLLIGICLVGILASILLPNLILTTMWLTARTLIVFPTFYFFLYLLISQILKNNRSLLLRRVLLFSSGIMVIYSFVLSSVFGTILKNNEEYHHYLAVNITDAILQASSNNASKPITLAIVGQAPIAPKSEFLYKRYPIMNKLAPNYLSQGWFWGMKQLSTFYKFNWSQDRVALEKEKCTLPLIKQTYLYNIRGKENDYILDFKKDC